jgi:hypothetical protein
LSIEAKAGQSTSKECRLETVMMIYMEVSGSVRSAETSNDTLSSVRVNMLMIRDQSEVIETKSRRGAPKITQ